MFFAEQFAMSNRMHHELNLYQTRIHAQWWMHWLLENSFICMKAKMFRNWKKLFLFVAFSFLILYVSAHRDYFIREHLVSTTPQTVYSLSQELDDTNTKLQKLQDEVTQMKTQAAAQSQQAAAAKASLQAIPMN